MSRVTKQELFFDDTEAARLLYGDLNRNLLAIERATGVSLGVRGTELTAQGLEHEVKLAVAVLEQLYELIKTGYPVYPADVVYALRILERSPRAGLKEIFLDKVYITANQRVVSPKSVNQKHYIESIRENDIVFGIGPAGTGKTYLAVAMAVAALAAGQVRSIILARPAVEAGEKLGFLPGDMAQKVNPYLRPLHDALHDMLGRERAAELLENGTIEIAPLAFMRGRTLNNAFVILDEAQNTSREQMKMFLTRLGFNSKAVITGDITQIDLPTHQSSGLVEASRILQGIEGIGFSSFTDADVVRHPLVQDIIRAYERKTRRKGAESEE
ncbi:MAG: PhoH family protein [Desulfobacteraceae bacterium]|nr:PhoH family protein [Desulfobacteraceae bacterium]